MIRRKEEHCIVCKKSFDRKELYPLDLARENIFNLISTHHPETNRNDYICQPDYKDFKLKHLKNILGTGSDDLDLLHQEVMESIENQEILAHNINESYEDTLTFGQRIADKVSDFGGSWGFVISFLVLLFIWMMFNTFILLQQAYDPYPYILLNLILSCVAALQAPIIMMSQNRREDRDRLQAENDYKVNLKAEVEIRHLNLKLDKLMTSQWNRLLDIQEAQNKILKEVDALKERGK